jgi:hypothetical protein
LIHVKTAKEARTVVPKLRTSVDNP